MKFKNINHETKLESSETQYINNAKTHRYIEKYLTQLGRMYFPFYDFAKRKVQTLFLPKMAVPPPKKNN